MARTRFIILTMARTGSTYLSRLLQQLPQIVSCDELFGENPRYSRDDYLHNLINASGAKVCNAKRIELESLRLGALNPEELLNRALWHDGYESIVSTVGFKLLLTQVFGDTNPGLEAYVKSQLPECRIIYLVRQNWLKQFISFERARQTGQWESHAGRPSVQAQPVCTTPLLLRQRLDHYAAAYEKMESFITPAQTVLKVSYEALIEDPEQTWDSVLDFLSVKREPIPSTTLKKQNSQSLSDCLANYVALKAAFVDTQYGKFFDE